MRFPPKCDSHQFGLFEVPKSSAKFQKNISEPYPGEYLLADIWVKITHFFPM